MKKQPQPPYGVPEKYWDSLSEKARSMYGIVRPMPTAAYTVDWPLSFVESALANLKEQMAEAGGSFELDPDFQRGHVWTEAQRIAYVEALIRKTTNGRILFNCPGWSFSCAGVQGDIKANTMQIVDGLQRLTAVRRFMAGEFKVFASEDFDGLGVDDLRGTPFDVNRNSYYLQIAVYEFPTREELLAFYLRLNCGGSVHSPQEIERVKLLLAQARGQGLLQGPGCSALRAPAGH